MIWLIVLIVRIVAWPGNLWVLFVRHDKQLFLEKITHKQAPVDYWRYMAPWEQPTFHFISDHLLHLNLYKQQPPKSNEWQSVVGDVEHIQFVPKSNFAFPVKLVTTSFPITTLPWESVTFTEIGVFSPFGFCHSHTYFGGANTEDIHQNVDIYERKQRDRRHVDALWCWVLREVSWKKALCWSILPCWSHF